MAAYCTLADLLVHVDEPTLAGLLIDTPGMFTTLDATATAALNVIIAQCSQEIEDRRKGHVDDVSDPETLTTFRAWCIPLVMEACYARRGHFGGRSTYGWASRAASVRKALAEDMPQARIHLGSAEEKEPLIWSSSEDSTTDFIDSASGGAGRSRNLLRGWTE